MSDSDDYDGGHAAVDAGRKRKSRGGTSAAAALEEYDEKDFDGLPSRKYTRREFEDLTYPIESAKQLEAEIIDQSEEINEFLEEGQGYAKHVIEHIKLTQDAHIANQLTTKRLNQLLHQNDMSYDQYGPSEWKEVVDDLLILNGSLQHTAYTEQECKGFFEQLHHLFLFKTGTVSEVADRSTIIFQSTQVCKQVYDAFVDVYTQLYKKLQAFGILEQDTDDGKRLHQECCLLAYMIRTSYQGYLTNSIVAHAQDPSILAALQILDPLANFAECDIQSEKKTMQFVYFKWRECRQKGLRRRGDWLYQPRYNELGQNTHSWVRYKTIIDFIWDLTPLDANAYWMSCLMNANLTMIVNCLTNAKTEYLPDLVRSRNVIAFRNGLFVISEWGQFFHFSPLKPHHRSVTELAGNIEAISFVDMDYRDDEIRAEMLEAANEQCPEGHYMGIQIPHIQSILTSQKYDTLHMEWFYAMQGRLLVNAKVYEDWQVAHFIMGVAGTGKSTLLKLLCSIFEPSDIGVIGNTVQRSFGFEGIYDKLFWVGLELSDNCEMDQAQFQSIVSCEPVSVNRKNKIAITVDWNIHGVIAANKMLPYTDNGGSIRRRIVLSEFEYVIRNVNPRLFEETRKELDKYLKVVTCAYLNIAQMYAGDDLKKRLPPRFLASEQKAMIAMDPILAYVEEYFERHPDGVQELDQIAVQPDAKEWIVEQTDFDNYFKKFLKKEGIKKKPNDFAYSQYNNVLGKKYAYIINPNDDKGDPLHRPERTRYIYGVRFKPGAQDKLNQAAANN